jgi:2'-5' RNA ligase
MSTRDDAAQPGGINAGRRLFFALWPEAVLAANLAETTRRVLASGAGRPQRIDQLHLTLEFLGAVPQEKWPLVVAAGEATAASGRPCVVILDALEHWRRPQVLCLVARDVPPELVALVRALRTNLWERGFEPETREFRVHLTLARKVRRPARQGVVEPTPWPVRELALVESFTSPQGSRYERLVTWPLGGGTLDSGSGSSCEPAPGDIA